jgi:hypothetical protein
MDLLVVMRGLDPHIHLQEGWIAGSSPAMTAEALSSFSETL